jgi:HEAT repeat protein
VTERFRLIYLKSTELEKSPFDESPSSYDPEEISRRASPSTEYNILETFSSQTILKQAKVDLNHPDPKVKILGIQYLEKSDPSIAIPLIQEILSDEDPGVRAQAISSLIKFRNPIVSPLLKRYLEDIDSRVRIAAIRGMFQLKERIDLNILLHFLSDESSWVRRKVATLLGWVQMESVFPVLMELSKDQDSKVRKAALFSMITLYPVESEGRWVQAMTDPDPDLRKWVRSTLEKTVTRPLKRRMFPLQNQG